MDCILGSPSLRFVVSRFGIKLRNVNAHRVCRPWDIHIGTNASSQPKVQYKLNYVHKHFPPIESLDYLLSVFDTDIGMILALENQKLLSLFWNEVPYRAFRE
ncbi:hypothetical protein EVAR_43801_1 [Eumeta japonica]|uniref:Uncharacterized protein n=1 Tax=Eumeta variegata TaxID=151549 RepID=A0A4C1XVY9_EUMVA|nr:hypothetical protein EVAR_43801_1 [Eumeta japonica]